MQQIQRRRGMIKLEITSMIDIIFLLLIYFLLTTIYAPPESQLTNALRAEKIGGGRNADLQPQIVEIGVIDGAPGYRVGQHVFRDTGSLTELLRQLPKDSGVFVRASNTVTVQWAVGGVQACRDADFTRITYVPAP